MSFQEYSYQKSGLSFVRTMTARTNKVLFRVWAVRLRLRLNSSRHGLPTLNSVYQKTVWKNQPVCWQMNYCYPPLFSNRWSTVQLEGCLSGTEALSHYAMGTSATTTLFSMTITNCLVSSTGKQHLLGRGRYRASFRWLCPWFRLTWMRHGTTMKGASRKTRKINRNWWTGNIISLWLLRRKERSAWLGDIVYQWHCRTPADNI